MPFTDGSAIKITISAYYTPNGRNIHGTGIEPDVECEFDGEDTTTVMIRWTISREGKRGPERINEIKVLTKRTKLYNM